MINTQHSILTARPARQLHYHHVTFNVTLTYPSNRVLLFDINKPSVSDVGYHHFCFTTYLPLLPKIKNIKNRHNVVIYFRSSRSFASRFFLHDCNCQNNLLATSNFC